MLRSIIQAQIEDGDHDEALAIIAKYGDKDFADRFRGMVRTSFTEHKIGQHLKDWLSALPDDEPPIKDSGSHLMGIEGITINKNDCVKQRDHLRHSWRISPPMRNVWKQQGRSSPLPSASTRHGTTSIR